jgi:hypothetical protein
MPLHDLTLSVNSLHMWFPRLSRSFFVYSFSFSFALSNLAGAAGDLSRAKGAISRTLDVLAQCEGGEGPSPSLEGATGHEIPDEVRVDL